MEKLTNLRSFALLHGFKAVIIGGMVKVWDNDGSITTANTSELKAWMGY